MSARRITVTLTPTQLRALNHCVALATCGDLDDAGLGHMSKRRARVMWDGMTTARRKIVEALLAHGESLISPIE